MPTQEELLTKARELGQMIADSAEAKALTSSVQKLKSDPSAQKAISDFNKLLQTLAIKEQSGLPIEPAEKRQLEAAQQAVATNLTLRGYQQAQVGYVDLMRKVDEALTSAGPDPLATPGAEPAQPQAGGARLVY